MRRAVWLVLTGSLFQAVFLHTVLEEKSLATHFVSDGLWQKCVLALGGKLISAADRPEIVSAHVSLIPILLFCLAAGIACWSAGAWWIARRSGIPRLDALALWGVRGW